MGKLIDADVRHVDALKPCPFCGSKAKITAKHFEVVLPDEAWIIECSNNLCPASYMIGWWYDTIEEAINSWNTRYCDGQNN